MNKQTIISDGQSLVDVTMQELGSMETLFDLADAAGLGITDALEAGQVLEVPTSSAANTAVANFYASRAYRVNTGTSEVATMPPADESTDFDSNDFDTTNDWY